MIDKIVQEYSETLNKRGVIHKIAEHPDLRTPAGVQGFLGLTLADGLSTMIMKADNDFVAVIRRDDCRMDLSKIKKELKVSNLRMASDEEFIEVTGLPVGTARVFNPGLKTLLDEKLFEKEYLTGGTGSFTCSFRYKSEDLKKIPNSKVADISKEEITNKRVYAGIRATGRLHLGNYLGSIKGMIELVNSGEYDCIFQVVDLHTITTPYNPETLQQDIREVVLDYLGAGLPVDKCHLTIQSYVPEHVLLSYLLGTIYPVSRLEDLPTYKEKKQMHPKYVNMGLLYYPVLMAADILVYKGEKVPVGIDQEPHLEIAREIARKFNSMFGQTFPEPTRFATKAGYVPSLRGQGKMSKSIEGSYITLTDDLETIKKRLAATPTDMGKGEKVPEEGGVAALLALVKIFEGDKAHGEYTKQYLGEGIKYRQLKEKLAGVIYNELQPIQKRRKYFGEHPEIVDKILEEGRKYCSKIAQETLREVKQKMGLI